MSTTVESVTESFPNSSIDEIIGEPTYATIKKVERALIENASSIQSELGGGQHGYLGLVLRPAKYLTITGNAFAPHNNPGVVPIFPPNATQFQIAQANATHKEQL